MRRKSMKGFIRENRTEIDECIKRVVGNPEYTLNDDERRRWILNDEGLYLWARTCGVSI